MPSLDSLDSADFADATGQRARVLDAWRASPARLREDANAEEDLFVGGYRDRLVVELAQNAADAATRAGVAGRLLLQLTGSRLLVANTGAPVDAAGVEALSTLRASAKRGADSVGRFGVGFAAVRAVSDDITLGSRSTGAVRWSLDETRRELIERGLLGPVGDRGIALPALRLPYSTSVDVPHGYETAVVIHLRDDEAHASVVAMMQAVDSPLLLSLPALTEVVVDIDGQRRTRSVTRVGDVTEIDTEGVVQRWLVVSREVDVDEALMQQRPVEERSRRAWPLTWALPFDEDSTATWPALLHAPTATDEPLGLPALLVAALPLEPTRRRAAPGPLLDRLLDVAGQVYADLMVRAATEVDDVRLLALLPGPSALGPVDAAIRHAALTALSSTAFLPSAAGTGLLRPRDAVVVDDASDRLLDALTDVVDGLLPAAAARRAGELERLGVRRLRLVDVIDALATIDRPPAWWHGLYAALGDVSRDALAALPVPLVDGRLVRGARGTLLADAALPPDALHTLGLRVVEPEAAHPLLERLGATRASARSVVASDDVRAAVDESHQLPDADAQEISAAVLALLVDAGLQPGECPWLGALLLLDDHGDLAPARELVLPGGVLASLVDPDEVDVVATDVVQQFGRDVLVAAGVLDGFALLREEDVLLDPDVSDHDLDDEPSWLAAIAPHGDAVAPELAAVRDLDLVSDDAWTRALAVLAQPPLRQVVMSPVRVLVRGVVVERASYTAWWSARHARIDGSAPRDFRLFGASALDGLWRTWPSDVDVDDDFARAVGVRSGVAALLADPEGPQELLDRLADTSCAVTAANLLELMNALAQVEPQRVEAPDDVRVLDGFGTRVVAAADALVLDRPDLVPIVRTRPLVPVASDLAVSLAEVLGLDLASDVVTPDPRGGELRQVPEAARLLLPGGPGTWVEHDDIVCDGVSIDWCVTDDVVHACTGEGLAKGLAWASRRWDRRWLIAAVLAEPDRQIELLAEAALDAPLDPAAD